MADLVTRCPGCLVAFKASRAQLQAANGLVRCGACLNIFDAYQNLDKKVPPPAQPAQVPPRAPEPLIDDSTDPEAVMATVANDTATGDEAQISADSKPKIDFVFRPQQDGNLAAANEPDPVPAGLNPTWSLAKESEDENPSPEESIEDLLESVESGESIAASAVADQDAEPAPTAFADSEAEADTGNDVSGEKQLTADQEETELVCLPQSPDALKSLPDPELYPPVLDDNAAEEPEEEPESRLEVPMLPPLEPLLFQGSRGSDPRASDQVAEQRRINAKIWYPLALLGLLAIAGQYLFFNWDRFSTEARFRAWSEPVCALFGCQLPPLVDRSKIVSRDFVVRSHPDVRDALLVDAVLINQADFDQPFPDLTLRFENLQGAIIAEREFQPRDYLQGELAGAVYIPVNQPVRLELEILDPGSQAVSFSLFIPE